MYITLADITAESVDTETLIQLTDSDNIGVVDEVAVDRVITAVCGEIDDLLRARYTVPFAACPIIIRSIAISIAAHKLYGLKKSFPRPESVKDDFTNSMKLLTSISTGTIKLGVPSAGGEIPTAPTSTGILVSAPTRRFDSTTLDSY
ncbi:MAG: phage protein Gp36 family protein [Desulfuromonadaceae bacterium]